MTRDKSGRREKWRVRSEWEKRRKRGLREGGRVGRMRTEGARWGMEGWRDDDVFA